MKRWHRWCCGAALAALGPAWAQSDAPPQAALWVEPRIDLRMTATDNAQLRAGQAQSEQTLEVSPGIRVVTNQARVKGFLKSVKFTEGQNVKVGDQVSWAVLNDGTGNVTGVSAVAADGGVTFTFSADPQDDAIISYIVAAQ